MARSLVVAYSFSHRSSRGDKKSRDPGKDAATGVFSASLSQGDVSTHSRRVAGVPAAGRQRIGLQRDGVRSLFPRKRI
ncbi:Hypothetical protein EPM1_2628 [Stenotrophomonas maltophilia EPM1]|nr:Hypothetical protein EPM1_2628 [Stenotrophomonas maltophilia EPM1]